MGICVFGYVSIYVGIFIATKAMIQPLCLKKKFINCGHLERIILLDYSYNIQNANTIRKVQFLFMSYCFCMLIMSPCYLLLWPHLVSLTMLN